MTSTLDLAQRFIRTRSVASNPAGLREVLRIALNELEGFTVERFESDGVESALVYVGATRPKRFKVLLNAHLDVIPGRDDEYEPRIKGRRLYGVGAMDMKSNAACLINAFKETARFVAYPLALQLVTDEEIGGFNGTAVQVKSGVRADFVLAGEPTNFDIVHKAKGIIWFKVHATGRAAHGAYPWRGVNALEILLAFDARLRKAFPPLTKEAWKTSVNLARIETSNTSFNKIPGTASACYDLRYVAGDRPTLLTKIRRCLPHGATLEIVADEPAMDAAIKDPYIQSLARAAHGTTGGRIFRGANGSSDARHFAAKGATCVEFGPVGGGIGADGEWVDIPSLAKFEKVLVTFLRSLDQH